MKQSTRWFRLQMLPALLLMSFSAIAQQGPQPPAKQELALEVDAGTGRLWEIPAFNGAYAEGSNFNRIESWKPSPGEAPVVSISFKIERENATVIAHVAVKFENDKEVRVGTYRLVEGETNKTEALSKFGLEPLVLRVVKAKPISKDPSLPIMPKLENKTKSIEVVSFYQAPPPLENSFQISLRNVSSKNVIALDLFMSSANGNGGSGQRARGDGNHPVMAPGGTSVHHFGVSSGGRMTAAGYVPEALQQTLIIRTAVFDDGTFEGMVEPAAEIEAQKRGSAIQHKRILLLLQEPNESNDGRAFTLEGLKEQAYSLGKTADESEATDLIARYSSLNERFKASLRQSIDEGLRQGKLEFLHQINDFEEMQKRPGQQIRFEEWLKQTKARYETLTTTR